MQPAVAPGPRSPFGLGSWPGLWTPRERVFRHVEYADRFGDVVRHRIARFVVHVLRHPDAIKHVLQGNHANYTKGWGLQRMKVFLGEGLLTSEGDHWRRQRKLAQPAFHRPRLAQLVGTMVEATRAMLDRWRSRPRGSSFDVSQETTRLTLNIAARTLFGADVDADAGRVGKAATIALEEANRRIYSPVDVPLAVPTPRNVRFREACKVLDSVVYGIIERRRRSGEPGTDLLSMLLEARDEETGAAMSDRELRDEVMTLLLAGHETTANALSWTLYLLSKNPGERRKLEAEVDRALDGHAPTFAELPALSYARMVIEESMRLFPPAWIFGRTAKGDDVVGGYRIPAGSLVVISPFVTHRYAAFWPNPEGFDPERFSPEASEGRHKYAYIPFGGGPRICIGNHFALLETQVVLAMIVQSFRLELVPGAVVEPFPMVTLRPRPNLPMTLHER
jgi:cytochrome P450